MRENNLFCKDSEFYKMAFIHNLKKICRVIKYMTTNSKKEKSDLSLAHNIWHGTDKN